MLDNVSRPCLLPLRAELNPPARKRRIVPQVSPARPESKRGRVVRFRKADIARAISAAAKAGLVARSVEITPEGVIRIIAEGSRPTNEGDLFDQWSDRL